MKFEEAFAYLRQGKRVRNTSWEVGCYCEYGPDHGIYYYQGNNLWPMEFRYDRLMHSQWEIYKPKIGLFGSDVKNECFQRLMDNINERLTDLESRKE